MDVYFKSQGYERISLDRVTDLNAPTHQGIDGVYYKERQSMVVQGWQYWLMELHR